MEYLYFTVLNYPGTAVATEALLILSNVVVVQKTYARLLFTNNSISEICRSKIAAELPEPAKRAVCTTYAKYHKWKSLDQMDLERKFDRLALGIMQYAIIKRHTSYRLNDLQFKVACLRIEMATNADELYGGLEALYAISPSDDSGFSFRDPYWKLLKSLEGTSVRSMGLKLLAVEERVLENKIAEVDRLRSQLTNRKAALETVKTLQYTAWHQWQQEYSQKLLARAEKLSKKPENKAQAP